MTVVLRARHVDVLAYLLFAERLHIPVNVDLWSRLEELLEEGELDAAGYVDQGVDRESGDPVWRLTHHGREITKSALEPRSAR